jgi:hypothetical protein
LLSLDNGKIAVGAGLTADGFTASVEVIDLEDPDSRCQGSILRIYISADNFSDKF